MKSNAGVQYVSGPMRLTVAVLIAVFMVVLGFGAVIQPRAFGRSNSSLIVIRKFDEFGTLGHCDLGARLDNFAIQLMNDPSYLGQIVAYGPEGEGIGSGRQRLKLMKDYLTDTRGLPGSRIKTIYAGRNKELVQPLTELWITPPGAKLDPLKFETNIDTFKGKFAEEKSNDFIDILYPEEMGPGIGLAVDAAFADMLQEQKKSVAYIVAFNGETSVPGSARRAAASQLETLKEHKADVSRIKTIFAGVSKETMIQLWILPAGDPPPATASTADPPPVKNVKITAQPDITMAFPENERVVFNRMLEVLKEQPAVKAVVIVSLAKPEPEPEPEPEATPIAIPSPEPLTESALAGEGDPTPADLPKMVEKWREELIKTHKIQPERFIVLFVEGPPDNSYNYLDLWVMPPGQPLPNPNDDEEEGDEDAVEKLYENLPPPDPHSLGTRLSALIRGN